MPRLFSAIELPETAALRLAALRAPLETARWVAVEDLHITLRFVGEVSRRQAETFAQALADIQLSPPRIRIAGTGVFGGKRPHSIHATVEQTPELDALARAHDHAARAAGLPPDKRKFGAHITLARVAGSSVDVVARFLERTGDLKIPAFWPTRTVLMSAREGGGGPYGVIDSFPFPGQSDQDTS